MTTNRKEQLLNLLEDDPKDPFIKYALGLEYIKEQNHEQALPYFEDVLTNHEEYLPVYYQAAELYILLEQNEQAESCYQRGIQIAKEQEDRHTLAELQNAYQNWLYELDE